ncbi:hypothetical protein GF377_01400 [candidate division GN15 bacterium]|nr:hypothetical protein [candidate division GN15 bacterium]
MPRINASRRVVFEDWLVEGSPDQPPPWVSSPDEPRQRRVRDEVASALGKLEEDERELVERFHFMGQTYREMACLSGREVFRVVAVHKRALRKLRALLAPLVAELYGIPPDPMPDCPICRSVYRPEIDQFIAARRPTETWRRVLRLVRGRYGLPAVTVGSLIGHERYHSFQSSPADKRRKVQ